MRPKHPINSTINHNVYTTQTHKQKPSAQQHTHINQSSHSNNISPQTNHHTTHHTTPTPKQQTTNKQTKKKQKTYRRVRQPTRKFNGRWGGLTRFRLLHTQW